LLDAAIAGDLEFTSASHPNFYLVAFFELQGFDYGGRKTNRQAVSPFCQSNIAYRPGASCARDIKVRSHQSSDREGAALRGATAASKTASLRSRL
jgi:hypothetical protein